jgi:hypothetical protein
MEKAGRPPHGGEGPSRSYVIMLAKILVIAMEDTAALGMEELSLRLCDGLEEIMDRYNLKPEDLNLVKLPPSE